MDNEIVKKYLKVQSSKVTLKNLSRLTGYSVSTVSKALNNRDDVSEKAKELIQKAAQSNRYLPNYTAIALRKQRTKTIALILPNTLDNAYGILLSEIQNLAFDIGYKLLVLQSFKCKEKEQKCMELVNDGSVDGLIILSSKSKRNTLHHHNQNIPFEFFNLDFINWPNENIKALGQHHFNRLVTRLN